MLHRYGGWGYDHILASMWEARSVAPILIPSGTAHVPIGATERAYHITIQQTRQYRFAFACRREAFVA